MPIYLYRCDSCKSELKEKHSINDKLTDCPICEEECVLIRIPSILGHSIEPFKKKRTGELVKTYIEEAKKDVASEKNKLKKEYEI